jgi:hypothetical protein
VFDLCLRGRAMAIPALLIALALWAGTGAFAVPVITRTGITPFYSPSTIMTARQDGGLPAVVYGSPPGRADSAGVLAPLGLPASVGGGHFVPAGREQTEGIRLVLVFNNAEITPQEVCEEPLEIRPGKAERGLDVFAVLCRGNNFFSHAHLRDNAVSGIRDPRYPDAMNQLLLALMPPEARRGGDFD